MKMKRLSFVRPVLCAICFVACFSILNAQPSIGVTPVNTEVEVNEMFSVDITSTDFDNIVSCQFSLEWDPDVIEYDTFASDLPPTIFFNEDFADQGRFSFVWAEGVANPVNFEDGTIVLRLFFKGLVDGVTPLDLVNTPTQLLAIYETEPGVTVETPYGSLENGTITVGKPLSHEEGPENASLKVFQNTPNPFAENTFIPFTLSRSELVYLDIFDINGINIYQYSKQYGEGTHFIRIEKEAFPEIGTYLFQLKTSDTFVTKKMILVR